MVAEGDVLWQASDARKAGLNLTRFIGWLNARGHGFAGYADLHAWSVADVAGFWAALAEYFEVILEGEPEFILTGEMPRGRWFTGTRMNYAEHVLRHEGSGDPGRVMLHHGSEARELKRFAFDVNRGFTVSVCRDSLPVGGGSWANPTRWIFGSGLWLMLRLGIRRGRQAGCSG